MIRTHAISLLTLVSFTTFAQPNYNFPAFAFHKIANQGNKLAQTALANVDNDGDLTSKPWSTGNVHFFLENKLIP